MSWRDRTGKERSEFFDWAADRIRSGIRRGKKSYPDDTFEGDPLDQAIEEVTDTLFYLYYIKRKQEMSDV